MRPRAATMCAAPHSSSTQHDEPCGSIGWGWGRGRGLDACEWKGGARFCCTPAPHHLNPAPTPNPNPTPPPPPKQSLICNEFIADAFPGPLLPPTPLARAHARLLIDQFGAKFSPAFGKVMFAASEADAKAAGAALDDALKWLDGALDAKGPFALGENFTIADCAMIPFALRLAVLEPLVDYKVPSGLARFEAWRAACRARASVAATLRQTPEAGRGWEEQMVDTYKLYLGERKKAAAAAGAAKQ